MNIFNKIIGCLLLLGAFVFSLICSSDSFAATPTLTLSLSGNSVAMDIVATNNTGSFASSNDLSISANTNNYSGYTLSISSNTNNAVLTGPLNATTSTNEVLNSIGTVSGVTTTGISANDFGNSSNTQYNDTWGYKPSKRNSASNTNFLPAPSTSGDVIDSTSAANSNNTPNSYTVSIGARVTPDTAVGAYSNTFVVSAVANLISYSITYDANDGNSGQDTTNMPTPNPQTGSVDTSTTTVTLSNRTPERDGFDFLGWCSVQVADEAACSGTEYQPSDSYTIDYVNANSFTLYARWETSNPCIDREDELYCKVRAEWVSGGSRVQTNDTNTSTGIKANISTASSGVFKYNSAVFGVDSDATKQDGTKDDIYYYRGILDSNLNGTSSTYGSAGNGATWPNYVILSSASSSSGFTTTDTCWRIVRTTASDGVKMIYNGKWTGSTCANATTSAQLVTSAFNSSTSHNGYSSYISYRNIAGVGYTYNKAFASVYDSSSETTIANVLGSNNDYSMNDSGSIIKQYLEGTWFANISNYTSILEASAGYCNDRTMYSSNDYINPLDESTIIVPDAIPYDNTLTAYAFGPNARDISASQNPSLTCPRSVVDLYSTTSNNGNGQLGYPVSLLTADESSFAGSGYSANYGSTYHYNSFLRSGSNYWLLSPGTRGTNGLTLMTYINENGMLTSNGYSNAYGIRPVISLIEGTEVVAGTGTATNPWIVNPPPQTIATASTMQDVDICDGTVPANTSYSLQDTRDGKYYTVAKLADGKCWMTQNLDLAGGTELSSDDTDMDASWTLPTNLSFQSGNKLPNSSNPNFWDDNGAVVHNSGVTTNCNSTSTSTSTRCYSYYSWGAATLGSGANISTDNADAPYSICPKGWRLPTARSTVAGNSDFYQLAVAYGMPSNVQYKSSFTTFYNNAGPGSSVARFTTSGYYNGSSFSVTSGNDPALYWSSTSYDTTYHAYGFEFDHSSVSASYSTNRRYGAAVRCVLKN